MASELASRRIFDPGLGDGTCLRLAGRAWYVVIYVLTSFQGLQTFQESSLRRLKAFFTQVRVDVDNRESLALREHCLTKRHLLGRSLSDLSCAPALEKRSILSGSRAYIQRVTKRQKF